MNPQFLIISTSLNPDSRSRILCQALLEKLKSEASVEWLDLRDHQLPLCDGDSAYGHPQVPVLKAKIQAADCILLGIPIYNFASSAAAKNLVEMTGSAWKNKVVGFVCSAGGTASYMSVMNLANSLMLDFRCLIIPRFVYASSAAFANEKIVDEEITKRIHELAQFARQVTGSIKSLELPTN